MKRLGMFLLAVFMVSPLVGQKLKDKEKSKMDLKSIQDLNVKVHLSPDIEMDFDMDFDFEHDIEINLDHDGGVGSHNGNWDTADYTQDEQEIEIPLSNPGERGKLDVGSHNGSIIVTGYDGQTVKVKMIKYIKKVDKDKTKDGMRLVSSGGFSVEAEEYNNTVKVENEGWNNRIDFVIQVPKNFDVKADTYNNGELVITDITGEIDAENYNGPIKLEGISGSASASTYNGSIVIAFSKLTPDKPMEFNTYNGKIDLTVPAASKFTAKMKTSKEIYTDFENFTMQQSEPEKKSGKGGRGYSIKYENWIQGSLNGGGVDVSMKTTNGNIYIRKGN